MEAKLGLEPRLDRPGNGFFLDRLIRVVVVYRLVDSMDLVTVLLVVEGVVDVSDMWLLLLVVVGKGKQLYSKVLCW